MSSNPGEKGMESLEQKRSQGTNGGKSPIKSIYKHTERKQKKHDGKLYS